MALGRDLAAPDDVHTYLVDRLNVALRKPGMPGPGEPAIRMLVDHLLFVERRPEAWTEIQNGLEAWRMVRVRSGGAL